MSPTRGSRSNQATWGLSIAAVLSAAVPCASLGEERLDPDATRSELAGSAANPFEAVDADFPLQGEFAGWQQSAGSGRSSQRVGLQVIARGGGQFDAVKYLGGLPGGGWRDGVRRLYSGIRLGSRLRLVGDLGEIDVHSDGATLRDRSGLTTGELRRIERRSPTLGAPPPSGAVVLFDGQGVGSFRGGRLGPEGWLQAGCETFDAWTDFRLHGEFRLPYKPFARGQDRGNSGFYLQSRYEVQVLDSFGLNPEFNDCGAIYRVKPPSSNICLPPLAWQTYDIDFQAPRFDALGRKLSPMRISVWHNGVPIHSSADIPSKTGAGAPEGPHPLPLKLQEHGNPVVYRNLWLIDTSLPGARSIDWLRLPLRADPVPVD